MYCDMIILGGDIMPVSKAQQKATHKYIKNNYDRMELMLKKGEKSRIKSHAESRGESVNAFAIRAINETIERDNDSKPLNRINPLI